VVNTNKNIHIFKSIILMLLVCMCINLFGQGRLYSNNKALHIQEKVNIRIPNKSKIEEYRKDARFEYKKEGKRSVVVG
jgi:hypothetical protein